VTLGGQDGASGATQRYTLEVLAGDTVTCSTSANNGDADLYVRFGAEAETNPNSTNNACSSYSSTSNESCTTGGAPADDTMWAGVQAYTAYSNLSVTCTITPGTPGGCTDQGTSCSSDADCCGACSGGKPSSRVCL
jgi:hypothetical protein